MPRKKKYASRVEEATEAIRNKILDLTLPPGKPINMRWLAADLGLGRTPSREALNRLAAEGLVHIEANQSAMARALDLDEINQLMEALRIAERISALYCQFGDPGLLDDVADMQGRQRRAVQEHRYLEASYWNAAFRSRIAATSRNWHLIEFHRRVANQARRLSCMIYAKEAQDDTYYQKQIRMLEGIHADLREALTRQDRERLIEVLESHVAIFKRRIAWTLEQPVNALTSLRQGPWTW
jgi:DNA-binding GntR family transcriptional regulator